MAKAERAVRRGRFRAAGAIQPLRGGLFRAAQRCGRTGRRSGAGRGDGRAVGVRDEGRDVGVAQYRAIGESQVFYP